VSYLTVHESFLSNPKQAFEDCFRRIDSEFLAKAEDEVRRERMEPLVSLTDLSCYCRA
jgi:hypothetical protein